MTWLIDADAFICLYQLSLLSLIEQAGVQLTLTGYIANHELNSLQREVARLEDSGIVAVKNVMVRTPTHKTFNQFKQQFGADKGEAEAVAWAVHHAPEATFVSNDLRARQLASSNRLKSIEVIDLAVQLVNAKILTRPSVWQRLVVWDDQRQSFCRPRDFTTLDATWRARGGS